MSTSAALDSFVALLPGPVAKGVTVVTPHDIGSPVLLHMSRDSKIKKFIPNVTRRTGMDENRSVPRISTAPTLLGCFVGYCAARSDYMYPDYEGKMYKGGWYVYGIPFQHAIKPNTKLLYDQKNSGEHWLVTYSPETREYPAEIMAKVFYSDVTAIPRSGKNPTYRCTIMIEVLSTLPLAFSKKHTLTKGCWKITGAEPTGNVESWKDDDDYIVEPVNKGDYTSVKKLAADMLSIPVSFGW
jgi:hypothetical protein